MTASASQAPSGYGTSDGQLGVVDVLVIVDRSGYGPPDGKYPPTHPMDKFVDSLGRHLHVFKDVEPYVATTQETASERELQLPTYAVVTNDRDYADWCHSEGGNLVEVNLNEESLTIKSQGQTEVFSIAEIASAVVFAADKIKPPSDQDHRDTDSVSTALDTGPTLLEPMSLREFRGTELILSELWQAIENDELNETQQYQIKVMAQRLESERRDTAPDDTKRWVLVALFQAAFRYILEHIPMDASFWMTLVEILQAIGWTATSGLLPM